MSLNYSIPTASSPVSMPDGTMSRDWYLFLCAVLQSIGGPPIGPGGGATPIEITQQFEEYSVTSSEGIAALMGVDEFRNADIRDPGPALHLLELAIDDLRNNDVSSQGPAIHDLTITVDELRNELSAGRGELQALRSMFDDLAASIAQPTFDDQLRARVQTIEDRIA